MSRVVETGDHEGCAATLVSGGRRVVDYRGAEMELDDGTWVPEGEATGWQSRPDQVYEASRGPAPEWVEQICHAE